MTRTRKVRSDAANMTGQKFGRLLVLGVAQDRRRPLRWLVRCDCGTEKSVIGAALRTGSTSSCGCSRSAALSARARTHGMHASPTYRSWRSMITRCENAAAPDWPRYGGRGICVCERWRSFDAFYADMGERPDGTSIDRLNVDGNYEPGNCRWATPAEQSNNTRSNRVVTLSGERLTIAQLIKRTGMSPSAVRNRVRRGWSAERIASTPVRQWRAA